MDVHTSYLTTCLASPMGLLINMTTSILWGGEVVTFRARAVSILRTYRSNYVRALFPARNADQDITGSFCLMMRGMCCTSALLYCMHAGMHTGTASVHTTAEVSVTVTSL